MNTPLNRFDQQDINDWILAVEKSFGIEFAEGEIRATTLDELHAAIMEKLPEQSDNSCTTQQAFYKLREALRTVSSVNDIRPSTSLALVLPKSGRRAAVRQLEQQMGFSLGLLHPLGWLLISLLLCLLASFILLFFSGILFAVVFLSVIAGLYLATVYGRHMTIKTVGELACKLSMEHYQACRRQSGTINRHEVDRLCRQWIMKEFVD